MRHLKRIAAAVLAAAMAAVMCIIPASAATIFDTAKEIQGGKKYTKTIAQGETSDYKIKITSSGTLKFKFTDSMGSMAVTVMDSDGAEVKYSEKEFATGTRGEPGYIWPNESTYIGSGTLSYKVSKGTYYIRIKNTYNGSKDVYDNSVSFSLSVPGGSSSTSSSSDSSSSGDSIFLYLNTGDQIQLGALVSGKKTSDVTWSSSSKKIAKVNSRGIVTAVKEGTAVITAKSSKGKITINIVVE